MSTLTIGGLLKHLALVEHEYFHIRIGGNSAKEPWVTVDFDADPSWEWRSAAQDSANYLKNLWLSTVEDSRSTLTAALEVSGVETLARWKFRDGRTPSVRRILLDLIEEYGRHNGHVDLLREAIDGRVGEDPPSDFFF